MKQIIGFLTLLLAIPLAFGADVPPPEKLLPADVLGVLTVPEYRKVRQSSENSPMIRLWNDPSMKAFREKFMAKFTSDVVTPLEREFGVKLSDYSGIAQGQVTLVLTANGPKEGKEDEPSFGVVLLVDCRDQGSRLSTNLATLRKKWVDGGKQLRTDKIRDVEFTTLIFSSDDLSKVMEKIFPSPGGKHEGDDEKPHKVEWMMGQSGSLFVLGNAPKDIEKILVNQSGGGAGTLGDQNAFASSQQTHFRNSQAFAWVNLKALLDSFLKAISKGENGGGPQGLGLTPDKIVTALGLNGLNALAINLQDSAEGTLLGFHIDAPESSRKGLLKMLSFEAKDASPPPFIPADTLKFSRFRFDLPKAWDILERTLTEAIPQFAGVVKMVLDNAGKEQDPNFDLRKNLIQNLGDDLISIEKAKRKQGDDQDVPSLTLISSPRPEQLASSIRALTALMPAQASKFKEREFLGRKVYALGLPASMAAGGKPVERTLHYAASGGYVALTMDIALLEEYLRSSDSSAKALRDVPGLAEAAQKVGGMGNGFFTYENQRETTRAEFETLKKESGSLANLFAASQLAGRLGVGNTDKFKEWVDFSLLPSYDQISKYFYQAVTGGAVTPQGFSFRMFTVTAPELRK